MKKVVNYLLAAAATVAVAASCTKQGNPLSYEGSTVVEFTADGGTKVITVKSDADITLTPSAKWIKATNVKNDITIAVGAVPDETSRHGELTVSNGVDTPIVFEIKQEGGKFTFAPQTEYTVSLSGGTIEIPYETNYEFTIKANDSWLSVEKKSGKVVLTAPAATAARTTKVTYEAGSNAGEFTVKQYNPVQISVVAELKDYSAEYTKKNTVFYTIKGTGVTSCAFDVVTEATFSSKDEAGWLASLKADAADPELALSAANLKKVNSEEGYWNGAINRKDNTKYYVVVYASNGNDEKVVYDSVTTEAETDPLTRSYSVEEISGFNTKSAIYGKYDYYANVHINTERGWGTISRPTKIGTITISDGGSEEYKGKTYEYVKISGFYNPFASYVKGAGGTDFVAEDLYWFTTNFDEVGWVVYPEPTGLVNVGTDETPNYKYYTFLAGGDNYLHLIGEMDGSYPLVGGVTEKGIFAFCDIGVMDEAFGGFDSWCICGITMSGNTIEEITGQYLSFTDWIFVPQAEPTQVSSKYGISTKSYSNLKAEATRSTRVSAPANKKNSVRDIKAVK